jgi:hypothetical protein
MPKGGKRAGAGRPKGSKDPNTLKAELFRSALIAKAITEQKEIFEALFGQAKLGNIPAIKELFERVMGKAPQPFQDDQGNAILPFQLIVKQQGNEQSRGGAIQ